MADRFRDAGAGAASQKKSGEKVAERHVVVTLWGLEDVMVSEVHPDATGAQYVAAGRDLVARRATGRLRKRLEDE